VTLASLPRFLTSGDTSFGVGAAFYAIDGDETKRRTTARSGRNTITFWSVDNAGNGADKRPIDIA
jgi:hypothetical protein